MKDTIAQIVQCALAIALGFVAYLWLLSEGETNPKAITLGVLLAGIGGSYLLTKLYVLIRYGRKAAKSMRWDA